MPHKEPSTVTAAQLEKFMQRWRLTRGEVGEALGVSERMIYWYLNGKHVMPKTVGLLMKALGENWSARK